MRSTVTALGDAIREHGLRATAPRIAVLKELSAARSPLTHAEVTAALAPAGFDRATVYRNLIDMAEVGLVRRADLGDHVWRFELAPRKGVQPRSEHAHFICSECGEVSCLPEEAVTLRPVPGVARALGERRLTVELRGVCDDCS